MKEILITNVNIVNEGEIKAGDLLIKNERIEKIGVDLSFIPCDKVIDGEGKFLLPGVIDDQVHFREPGLTHKASIYSEAKAAVAGGITSYMEMPNTVPAAVTQEILQEKYDIAEKDSLANYSFYMGATNANLSEVLRTDPESVCGVKIFMGSSTGNMLVDNEKALEELFSKVPMLIATHCEDEETIRKNTATYRQRYGENVPINMHPEIRSEEACYKSSSHAVALAKTYGTRLHILHISTAKELGLFRNDIPLKDKKITSEACIHHFWFDDSDYARKGTLIKWNPAVKTRADKEGILAALADGRIDVIATDHAPHTLEEKQRNYFKAPSGGPMVQHALPALLEIYHRTELSLEEIVAKTSHNPAILFKIKERGFIREGYYADLVIADLQSPWEVRRDDLLYKCGWSPMEGEVLHGKILHTFVSGHHVYAEGNFNESRRGKRLAFWSN